MNREKIKQIIMKGGIDKHYSEMQTVQDKIIHILVAGASDSKEMYYHNMDECITEFGLNATYKAVSVFKTEYSSLAERFMVTEKVIDPLAMTHEESFFMNIAF